MTLYDVTAYWWLLIDIFSLTHNCFSLVHKRRLFKYNLCTQIRLVRTLSKCGVDWIAEHKCTIDEINKRFICAKSLSLFFHLLLTYRLWYWMPSSGKHTQSQFQWTQNITAAHSNNAETQVNTHFTEAIVNRSTWLLQLLIYCCPLSTWKYQSPLKWSLIWSMYWLYFGRCRYAIASNETHHWLCVYAINQWTLFALRNWIAFFSCILCRRNEISINSAGLSLNLIAAKCNFKFLD